jgi:chromate reductase
MDGAELTLLGIAGSLRKGSYNKGLIEAAGELAPEGMRIEVYEELGEIPPYNEDVRVAGEPGPVEELKAKVAAADGLLIATPEYNYNVPGVLKNAIDWLSRPPAESPLRGKPAGIMGASAGNFGTARAQLALRQSFVFTETLAMLRPELLVFRAAERFNEQGRLTDETTRELLRGFLAELAKWVGRMKD